ncbi:DUF3071 domain-containing protein [Cellulomonas sp. APG4]|uniref:septation protein SepH n=1 Tax=Cellulomonas sp. APG4 TaxID=1538656 RepID=UPI00137A7E2F|nr:septation protein SepH [Cellulomonas sp. APG4]NCT90003.1 DUF3071 domain-containing protein [Cellulomonas sp. APG4]
MSELELVGLHEDGEHIVLQGPDGQRFRLPIDEALRAAVRRDRPQLEQARVEAAGALPPREIQSRIRAGASAEEVAEESGMSLAVVRRYEGPVLAERDFVASQARATRIGHDASAPVLGDLVTDRLATRGVEAATIAWDAARQGSGPWTVQVTFTAGDGERSARWVYDAGARTVRAVDDEARWLSETELADEPIPRRHLAAVRDQVFDVEVDEALRPVLASVDLAPAPQAEPEPEPDPQASTHALLDDLTDRRGVRQELSLEGDDDEDFEGFGPQHTFDFAEDLGPVPAAHPPHSRPEEAVDARVLDMPARRGPEADHATRPPQEETLPLADVGPGGEPAPEAARDEAAADEAPAPARRSRKGRASVPSWDEIVFGARTD